jgi:Flp pilus assembly protein CpaB
MKPARIILTVLVLAGAALGVFTVSRGTAPQTRGHDARYRWEAVPEA